jgi:hypothetical protein
MFGAWVIRDEHHQRLAEVDLNAYGQKMNERPFSSPKAERVARTCLAAIEALEDE